LARTRYIDYIIADQTVIPWDQHEFYSEKIVYIPNSYYPTSYQINDAERSKSNITFTRAELGLPLTGFVFCCFNNNYKIMPHVFDCWMRILKQVDASALWLLEDNATAAGNLRREAAARGVNGERLIFANRQPLAEHLARHRLADLFLDTLPYNAHTTASDALWVGLPTLTCLGETFAGRVAASLLRAVGLPERITTSLEDYEALAVRLARDPSLLASIKSQAGA
jgi:predicted O-linked N-acetylglucosamine transferase (SPINDLY family)